MATTYRASIPMHHESNHKSEQAAIRALRAAERKAGLSGQVEALTTSGTYQSTQVLYPRKGEIYAR